jgi:signal peptidase II
MLVLHQPVGVIPVFALTKVYNAGAAFSFLGDASGWQRWFFITLSIIVSGVLLVWLRRLGPHEGRTALALALILGGAIGNLIDRLVYGYVIDFLDVYYGDWHWPTFNLADSAITAGACLLILDALIGHRKAAAE